MKLEVVKSEGLAHNSYYLSDEGEAVVVDPRRDSIIYWELAEKECAKIKYILETHRNEDYVIGSLELQALTDAEIGHSDALPFRYGEHSLTDGDTLDIGNLKIKVIHTPGHTNESVSYVVYPSGGTEATSVFSGDTLFSGSVGRTDLYGKGAQQTQAEKLFNSLHEKLLPLGGGVLVYPAHGAGSVCGHGIGRQEPTSLGYEKKTNPYLSLSKEEFLGKTSAEELFVPRYFRKMEEYNLNGPPLLSRLVYPEPFSLEQFDEETQESTVMVMDTRQPYAYAGSHIPNSLSMWLGGVSVYPGWLLDINQYFVFVLERQSDIDVVAPRMRRLGFDNMCGYLCGGMNTWQDAGKPINNTGTMGASELKDKVNKREVTLLDVREPDEWREEGAIEGATKISFADLPSRIGSVPTDKLIAVTCSVGNRASIATSILERAGMRNISNVLGGMTAWTKLGYQTKKE